MHADDSAPLAWPASARLGYCEEKCIEESAFYPARVNRGERLSARGSSERNIHGGFYCGRRDGLYLSVFLESGVQVNSF